MLVSIPMAHDPYGPRALNRAMSASIQTEKRFRDDLVPSAGPGRTRDSDAYRRMQSRAATAPRGARQGMGYCYHRVRLLAPPLGCAGQLGAFRAAGRAGHGFLRGSNAMSTRRRTPKVLRAPVLTRREDNPPVLIYVVWHYRSTSELMRMPRSAPPLRRLDGL
jgi:hypothetical protein